MVCQSSPGEALDPIAGGPFDPPGRLEAVEPRSVSAANGVRTFDVALELEAPAAVGVLKRFSAVAREVPPVAAEPPAPGAAAVPDDDEEFEVVDVDCVAAADVDAPEELEELVDEEEVDEDVEVDPLCPEALKAGVLEMAEILAREAEGSEALGVRRLPRSWGTSKAAKRSGAVVPVRRMVRSSDPDLTRTVRTDCCRAEVCFASEPEARKSHPAQPTATASAGTSQRSLLRRLSGLLRPWVWECISAFRAQRHRLPASARTKTYVQRFKDDDTARKVSGRKRVDDPGILNGRVSSRRPANLLLNSMS